MKNIYLMFIFLCLCLGLRAQVSKTVEVTAGNLSRLLSASERSTVTDLTITGTIDARDFKTMRDSMARLAVLDMSQATIVGYTGYQGTYIQAEYAITYNDLTVPQLAFERLDFKPNTTLVSVKIPLNTQIIEQSAFGQCQALTGFTIPPSVKWIMQSAFSDCTDLTAITIPPTVTFLGWAAFSGCTGLTSMVIPPGINDIKEYLFNGCTALTSVELPSTLLLIGSRAFAGCSALPSLSIPSGVVSIGENAFLGCTALESLNIPSAVTSIGEGAFDGCSKWKGSLNLPQGLGIVKSFTFRNCSSLSWVHFPSGLDTISASAFEGCSALSGPLALPSALKLIGARAFSGCSHLTGTLTFPATLAAIGARAFDGCSAFTGQLALPPLVRIVEDHSFAGCSGFTSLIIPATIEYINSGAFSGCSGLTSIRAQKVTPVPLNDVLDVFTGVNKATTTLHVPFGSKEAYAAAAGWNEFTTTVEDTQGLWLGADSVNFSAAGGSNSSIILKASEAWTATSDKSWLSVSPASGSSTQILTLTATANNNNAPRAGIITIAATGTASQVIHVTQVSAPLVIQSTAGHLKEAITEEQRLTITNLVVTGTMNAPDFGFISDMPLLSVLDLGGVTITPYHERVAKYDFLYPENAIPGYSGGYSGDYALRRMTHLTSLILPSSTVSIGSNAFEGDSSLTSIVIPSTVLSLGEYVFRDCTSLTSCKIPSSVVNMGYGTFTGCRSLTNIELPEGINYFNGTFIGSTSLRNIHLPASLKKMGNLTFANCSSLIRAEIPPLVTTIGYGAFSGCSALSTVSLPSSLDSILSNAFSGCIALTTLTIPSRVTYIEHLAFSGCSSLQTIYANPVQPPHKEANGYMDIFEGVDKTNCVLYVPVGSKALYAQAEDWKDFQHIVEMEALKLSVNSFTMEAIAGTASVAVTSTKPWSATSDQPWLTVVPASGTENATVTLSLTANAASLKRMAIVTFTAGSQAPQTVSVVQKGNTATIELTAGRLNSAFTLTELKNIQRLTIKGTMDARDFKTIRDKMTSLTELDISQVTIVAYSGKEGTRTSEYYEKGDTIVDIFDYPANELPPMAFSGYSRLITTVALPPSLQSIGFAAFAGLRFLTVVHIPVSVTSIGDAAFNGCSSLTSLVLPPNLIHIPEALCSGSAITSINIPSTVTSVGSQAFGGCINLTTVYSYAPYPPEIIVEMYQSELIFEKDSNLTTLYVPYGAVDAYKAAPNEWSKIKNTVELPGFRLSAVTVALNKDQSSVAAVGIQSNVTWTASSDQSWLTITPSTGSGNDSLTFNVEANTMEAGRMAKVTVSATDVNRQMITVIQQGVVDSVKLTPGGLATAFTADRLNGITHLILSGEMDARDFRVLRDRMPLLTILDMSRVTIKEYLEADPLTKVHITHRYQSIPDMAFYDKTQWKGKTSLTRVIFPLQLEKIGNRTFADARGLTEITIPSSVRFLDHNSFNNCAYIKTIVSHMQAPPDSYDDGTAFYNVDKAACTLFVPRGTIELYRAANLWKAFKNIVELGEFRIMTTTAMVEAAQGSKTSVALRAQVPWSAASNEPWLTVSPASGTGNQDVVLTAAANPSDIQRKATVTFSAPGYLPLFLTVYQNGAARTIDLSAGNLSGTLTPEEQNGITHLVIKGTMDARDFRTIRDHMPVLRTLDLTGATIVAYSGTGGTNFNSTYNYLPNAVPPYAFYYMNDIKSQISTILLPDNLTLIEYYAFGSSKTISYVSFPSSLTTIRYSAFSDTRALKTVVLSEGLDSIGY
ncbi:MAG: leucine-rich repeat protein, partial [Candidatus Saccharibacteria bacterium]